MNSLAAAAPDQKAFAVQREQAADSSLAAVIAVNNDAYTGALRDRSHPWQRVRPLSCNAQPYVS